MTRSFQMIIKRHIQLAINQVKRGAVIHHRDKIYTVQDAMHHHQGRAGGHYKLDLKDIKSGTKTTERFNTTALLEGTFNRLDNSLRFQPSSSRIKRHSFCIVTRGYIQ